MPAAAKKSGSAGGVIGVLVVVGLLGAGCIALVNGHHSSSAPTRQEIEATVIDTCQDSIKKQLKDPDSAKFGGDWKAWIVPNYSKPPPVTFHPEQGDKYWNAGGSVNAKNSFGGYVGDQAYACDAAVTSSGDVNARAYSLSDLLNQP